MLSATSTVEILKNYFHESVLTATFLDAQSSEKEAHTAKL